ncbi:MAG: mechanosensitive ion channel family protein [Bacteroidota bacterium]|nr:mechanosensitive ion channel family protein [Bacteroidota bacterium]
MWDNFIDYWQRQPKPLWNLLIVLFAVVVGLVLRLILSALVKRATRHNDYSLVRSIIRRMALPVNLFLPLFILNILKDELQLRPSQLLIFDRFGQIFLTIAIAYILIAIIKIIEDYVVYKYDLNKPDNLRERKIRTQLQFIRRLSIGLIVTLALCLIFLSFPNLRKLGAGLLTGVGIGGIIVGFAAQKSLANFLAGMQIAFTQPLRLDDVLVVEGEWGRVDEITLTYVVLAIWDQRRLILPITYFIEKPFQNWTRTGSDILSAAMIYVDYTVPVDEVRKEFLNYVQKQTLWDKRLAVLQVTNWTDKTVEMRCLVSTSNAGDAFDLRCLIREHLLLFIQTKYPQSLPKARVEWEKEKLP